MLTFFGIDEIRIFPPPFFYFLFFVQFDNEKPKLTKMYKFFSEKDMKIYAKSLISV